MRYSGVGLAFFPFFSSPASCDSGVEHCVADDNHLRFLLHGTIHEIVRKLEDDILCVCERERKEGRVLY